jgi:hypothetical protein
MLSLVTFCLFYRLFLCLAEVLQFCSTYFAYPFVSYLRPTGRTFPSYLVFFTIKSHVHRTENHHIITPQNRSDFVFHWHNFVFCSRDFVYCRTSLPLVYFAVYFIALCHALLLVIIPRRSSSPLVMSSWILLGILFIYILSFLIYLLGC